MSACVNLLKLLICTAEIFTSFFGHAHIRLNVLVLCVGRNWIFFLKMWLKLEFIICFRCTQDARRLAITKSKIIEQNSFSQEQLLILSLTFSKFISGKNCSRLFVPIFKLYGNTFHGLVSYRNKCFLLKQELYFHSNVLKL